MNRMITFAAKAVAPLCLAIVLAKAATAQQPLALDIFKELIEINTVTESGDTLRAAQAVATRLRAAGFDAADVQVLSPAPRKGNLVARLRGTGARKPILLLAHLDVVPANPADWSIDPFKFTEKDGYYYGRGTSDDKYMAAAFVANLFDLGLQDKDLPVDTYILRVKRKIPYLYALAYPLLYGICEK